MIDTTDLYVIVHKGSQHEQIDVTKNHLFELREAKEMIKQFITQFPGVKAVPILFEEFISEVRSEGYNEGRYDESYANSMQ